MQFLEFKEKIKPFIVFTINDIRKIEPDFDLRRLNEWGKKGYINMIRRGHYMLSNLAIDDQALYTIANIIYQPSYVSLEIALSNYGLIPEAVYVITSVTTLKTADFSTNIARFTYKHIRPELMFGYTLETWKGAVYKIADMEKAVLDYLYFHPRLRDYADFAGIRFNVDEFLSHLDEEKFKRYIIAFGNKALEARAHALLAFAHNDTRDEKLT